jgi:hypothetical protein
MGLFRSPLGNNNRKDQNNNGGDGGSVSGGSRGRTTASPSNYSSLPEPPLNLAPPLFQTFHDSDHQLLKNLKKRPGLSRRHSHHSDSGATPMISSAMTQQQRALHNSISDFGIPRSLAVSCKNVTGSNKNNNDRRVMDSIGLSPFAGRRPLSSSRSFNDQDKKKKQPLSTGTTAKADTTTVAEAAKLSIPLLALHDGSDSVISMTSDDLNDAITRNDNSNSPKQEQQQPSSSKSGYTAGQHHSDDSCSYFEEILEEEDEEDDHDDDDEYYEEIIVEDGGGGGGGGMLNHSAASTTTTGSKKVRFDDYDEMQLTLHISDYSDQEIKKSWYKREDYDGMIQESRSLVQKAEERRDQLLLSSSEITNVGTQNGNRENSSILQQQLTSSMPIHPLHTLAHKSELETRGLEAWSSSGAEQVRSIKETAIEAVWNEQERQWEAGILDLETLRDVYHAAALPALRLAEERGFSDHQVAEKIRQMEELQTSDDVKQKRRRATSILVKSRSILGRSVKVAGKMARETGKRGAKAGVGAVTLDPRMLLEAIQVEKKKRESKANQERRVFKQPSLSSLAIQLESSSAEDFVMPSDDDVSAVSSRSKHQPLDISVSSRQQAPQKREKLKLLGVVPIPGTQKMYNEDRREKKAEDRRRNGSGFATWESSLAEQGKL